MPLTPALGSQRGRQGLCEFKVLGTNKQCLVVVATQQLMRQRQEDLCEFEVLIYRGSPRTAKGTQRNSVLKGRG